MCFLFCDIQWTNKKLAPLDLISAHGKNISKSLWKLYFMIYHFNYLLASDCLFIVKTYNLLSLLYYSHISNHFLYNCLKTLVVLVFVFFCWKCWSIHLVYIYIGSWSKVVKGPLRPLMCTLQLCWLKHIKKHCFFKKYIYISY